MAILPSNKDVNCLHLIAREFLVERLGVEPTPKNVALFVEAILRFEETVAATQKESVYPVLDKAV